MSKRSCLAYMCAAHLVCAFSVCYSANTESKSHNYVLQTIAEGLQQPWAMIFLPNGDLLVTERAGKLKIVRKQRVLANDVSGVPSVYFAGQGGLLDVMLDQNFAQNQIIYLSLAHGKRNANSTRLISAKLIEKGEGYKLEDQTVLFTAQPPKRTAHHYGARIAQLDDGTLLVTVGDGFNNREQAQTLDNHLGKIIRINRDGSAPKNNPFIDNKEALPEIYTLGHRNEQGMVVANNIIYAHEHGPKGGDEVNIITPGTNYGWPIATVGIDYNGARISPFTSYDGMQSPLVNWTPSIAPSSMTMHKGSLYVTTLAEQSIRKLSVTEQTVIDHGVIFEKLNQRLRDVVSGPDGHLYVMTDGDDARIVRIIEK